MDEYTFWQVYFTLCRRYLPDRHELEAAASATRSTGGDEGTSSAPAAGGSSTSGAGASSAAPAAAAAAAAAGVAAMSMAEGAAAAASSREGPAEEAGTRGEQPAGGGDLLGDELGGAGADGQTANGDGASDDDEDDELDEAMLAELEDDPDLDAYLQACVGPHGGGGRCAVGRIWRCDPHVIGRGLLQQLFGVCSCCASSGLDSSECFGCTVVAFVPCPILCVPAHSLHALFAAPLLSTGGAAGRQRW